MSRIPRGIYLSALALASAWAVARLVRAASDLSDARAIGTGPAGRLPPVPGFDSEEYLRRKGIDLDEVVGVAQASAAERRAVAHSRALGEVAVALGPLLAFAGLYPYFRRMQTRPPHVT
jgi:hypothetical protein